MSDQIDNILVRILEIKEELKSRVSERKRRNLYLELDRIAISLGRPSSEVFTEGRSNIYLVE